MTTEQYLQDHSLDAEFIQKKFAVQIDADRLTIPVYDPKGNLLYCRYRHMEGTAKFTSDKGAHPALFAAHMIAKHPKIVLCEGEPDCMRLWQEKIPAVTGTTGVKTFSAKVAAPLKGKEVMICLDTDDAGKSAVEHYFKVLTEVGAKPSVIDLPPEYKDVSEYFTAGHTGSDFATLPVTDFETWQDKNEPDEYAFEEGTELMSRQLPPEEWLVDRILPTEGFCFIVGAEATAKSFYSLTLANSVATGAPWISKFPVKQSQKVLIIDKENTKRRTQSRMRGLKMTGKNIFWLKYPHYFEMLDPDEDDGFSKIAKAAARKVAQQGIKLIVVDSFTDVMIGNENAAGDVQAFFDNFRRLFPGTSILVLHHASKPSQGVIRTAAQRARGSSNLMAQVYSAFFVEAKPKFDKVFTIENTKAGDSEKLKKFEVELKVEPVPGSTDGKTYVTGIEYKGEVIDQEAKEAEAAEMIEEAFSASTTIPRGDLMDMLQAKGVSQRTADRSIKKMIEEGLVEAVQDPTNKARRNYLWIGEKSGEIYEE